MLAGVAAFAVARLSSDEYEGAASDRPALARLIGVREVCLLLGVAAALVICSLAAVDSPLRWVPIMLAVAMALIVPVVVVSQRSR